MTGVHDDAWRGDLALGGLVFAAVAPSVYAFERLYERARVGVVDPALILMTTHVDYLWRVGVAVWCGGVAALFAIVVTRPRRRQPAPRVERALALLTLVAAVATAALAFRFP
jgi:hypothetical protein